MTVFCPMKAMIVLGLIAGHALFISASRCEAASPSVINGADWKITFPVAGPEGNPLDTPP